MKGVRRIAPSKNIGVQPRSSSIDTPFGSRNQLLVQPPTQNPTALTRMGEHTKSVQPLYVDYSSKLARNRSKAVLPALSVSQVGAPRKGLAGHGRGSSLQHASCGPAFASRGEVAEGPSIVDISSAAVGQMPAAQSLAKRLGRLPEPDGSLAASAQVQGPSLR